jgi:hypothetical protein
MRRFLIRLVLAVAGLYVAATGALFAFQRSLLYAPGGAAMTPAEAGLERARALTVTTADGQRLPAWYVAPRSGRALILYFHGNGDSLADCAPRIRRLTATGDGVLSNTVVTLDPPVGRMRRGFWPTARPHSLRPRPWASRRVGLSRLGSRLAAGWPLRWRHATRLGL